MTTGISNAPASSRKYYVVATILIAAVLASTFAAYPHLPNTIPMHWDARGHVNGWGAKWTLFVINPGIMALTLFIFSVLPWLSPKQFQVESARLRFTSWSRYWLC